MTAAAPKTTDVVILCGGRGTRLGALSADTPKPLLPVGGQPFLLRLIRDLRREGFTRILLAAHYLADQIEAFAAEHQEPGMELRVIVEPEPLGTGGCLRHACSEVRSPVFVVLNGDSCGFGFTAPVLAAHALRARRFTMVVVRADRVEGGARRKGMLSLGPDGEIQGFVTGDAAADQWVNAGCYVCDRELIHGWPAGAYDLEQRLTSLVPPGDGVAYFSDGSLLDIGTPETYAGANQSKSSNTAQAAHEQG